MRTAVEWMERWQVPLYLAAFVLGAGFFWALYILASERVGGAVDGAGGLAMALVVGTVALVPFGAQGAWTGLTDVHYLALAIGKAVGATITLIPEEFRGKKVAFDTLVDILAGAVIKRQAYGRADGIALLAEGLADCIDPEDLARHTDLPRDHMGNLHVADVPLGEVLEKGVKARLAEFGLKATLIPKYIGYEVRCADPIPFDMEYTRDLGHCAARYVIEGGTEAVVSMVNGRFVPVPFAQMKDPATGRPGCGW